MAVQEVDRIDELLHWATPWISSLLNMASGARFDDKQARDATDFALRKALTVLEAGEDRALSSGRHVVLISDLPIPLGLGATISEARGLLAALEERPIFDVLTGEQPAAELGEHVRELLPDIVAGVLVTFSRTAAELAKAEAVRVDSLVEVLSIRPRQSDMDAARRIIDLFL